MKYLFIGLYYILFSHLPVLPGVWGKVTGWCRYKSLRQIIKVGKGTKIGTKVYVGLGKNISIGNYCQINSNIRLSNVIIGDYVMIARNTIFSGAMHEYSSKDVPMVLQGEKAVNITQVENDVWIGLNCIILPGINISKGSIIGAGAVVTKNTEPYGIYAGVPAKLIRKR